MNEPLRVLVLEDCAVAGELVKQELAAAGLPVITERVDSQQAFAHALEDFAPDIVLRAAAARTSTPPPHWTFGGRCAPRSRSFSWRMSWTKGRSSGA